MAAGGVCGTDLHYYNHGGFGTVLLKEPMILGHEVAGHVAAVGPGVEGLPQGDLVAVSPSRPCGDCRFCAGGLHIHCPDMRFYGSAMPFPHIQGAFREELVADASQCVRADGLSAGEAAMAEPLSVCLHATRRAGELKGKRVLVTGCGPIGVLSILAARWAGAAEIVATDLVGNALKHASMAGADRVIDVSEAARRPGGIRRGQGVFRPALRVHGFGGCPVRSGPGDASARSGGAGRARRRHDGADDADHRKGTRPARLLPVSRGVRDRGGG